MTKSKQVVRGRKTRKCVVGFVEADETDLSPGCVEDSRRHGGEMSWGGTRRKKKGRSGGMSSFALEPEPPLIPAM